MFTSVSTDKLSDRYSGGSRRLICRVSFEGRSLVVPRSLQGSSDLHVVGFASKDRSALAEANLAELRDLHPRLEVIELDTSNPIASADSIHLALKSAAKADGLSGTIIDVSSFRREELLILVAALQSLRLPFSSGGELIYIGAAAMSNDWLSRNIVAHRSVIGYAGEIWPSRRTKLVLMIGFEVDRARSIIENYEPASVILGMGGLSESISPDLHARNKSFFEDMRRQFQGIEHTFEFSARDPEQTVVDLERSISLDRESNVILAPLHTKLSTIGAGLFASRHKQVQVCYAQAGEYNESTYSVAGTTAYVVPLEALVSRQDESKLRKNRLTG